MSDDLHSGDGAVSTGDSASGQQQGVAEDAAVTHSDHADDQWGANTGLIDSNGDVSQSQDSEQRSSHGIIGSGEVGALEATLIDDASNRISVASEHDPPVKHDAGLVALEEEAITEEKEEAIAALAATISGLEKDENNELEGAAQQQVEVEGLPSLPASTMVETGNGLDQEDNEPSSCLLEGSLDSNAMHDALELPTPELVHTPQQQEQQEEASLDSTAVHDGLELPMPEPVHTPQQHEEQEAFAPKPTFGTATHTLIDKDGSSTSHEIPKDIEDSQPPPAAVIDDEGQPSVTTAAAAEASGEVAVVSTLSEAVGAGETGAVAATDAGKQQRKQSQQQQGSRRRMRRAHTQVDPLIHKPQEEEQQAAATKAGGGLQHATSDASGINPLWLPKPKKKPYAPAFGKDNAKGSAKMKSFTKGMKSPRKPRALGGGCSSNSMAVGFTPRNSMASAVTPRSPRTMHKAADGTSLTFSAPPYVPKAIPHPRKNQTFNAQQLREIERNNDILARKLVSLCPHIGAQADRPISAISYASPAATANLHTMCNARRRTQYRIVKDNHALLKRLLDVKPSRELSRDVLQQHYDAHRGFLDNISQFKTRRASAPAAIATAADSATVSATVMSVASTVSVPAGALAEDLSPMGTATFDNPLCRHEEPLSTDDPNVPAATADIMTLELMSGAEQADQPIAF